MRLLNCEIYQHGRVSSVADTELIQVMGHLKFLVKDELGAIKRNKNYCRLPLMRYTTSIAHHMIKLDSVTRE